MFFIMGLSDGRKDFDFPQTTICASCGRYGRYIVYMTYTCFTLFFIPIFRWNKQYFVKMSCCGETYILDPEVGKRIARGEKVEIQPTDLRSTGVRQRESNWESSGWNKANWNVNTSSNNSGSRKTCANCGYSTDEDFEFCPKCGKKFQDEA